MNRFVYALTGAALVFSIVLALFFIALNREPRHTSTERTESWPGTAETSPPTATEQQTRRPVKGSSARGGELSGKTPQLLTQGGAELVVEIIDRARQSRPGLAVHLLSGNKSEDVVTDGNGLAVFSSLASGAYSFRLRGEGIPDLASVRVITLHESEQKHITLTVGSFDLEIAGRVLNKRGLPVPGVDVFARKQRLEVKEGDFAVANHASLHSRSGPDGNYRLVGLESADYMLRTKATPRYPPIRKIFRAGVKSADLFLEEARDLQVYGVVTSTEGQLLTDVSVSAVGQASRPSRTDQGGHYSLLLRLSDEKATYMLKARREGYREKGVNVRPEEVEGEQAWELDIVLDPLGATVPVTGIIVDANEMPLAGKTVILYSARLSAHYAATSNPQGRFALPEVQVGDYRLSVYVKQGYKDYVRDPVTVPAEGLDLTIPLESIETRSLRGRMVDPHENPIARFTLWVRSTHAVSNVLSVAGDDRGFFEVEDVPVGNLLFETRSLPRLSVRGVMLEAVEGETVHNVNLVLDWGTHGFSGRVVDENDSPIAGARVSLSWDSNTSAVRSSSLRKALTDAGGRFAFSELAAGEHKIGVSSPGFEPGQSSYRVGGGKPEPTLRLKRREEQR